jgi:hypothetical protein
LTKPDFSIKISQNINKGRLNESVGDAIFLLVLVVDFRQEGACRPVSMRLIIRHSNSLRTVGSPEAHGPFYF